MKFSDFHRVENGKGLDLNLRILDFDPSKRRGATEQDGGIGSDGFLVIDIKSAWRFFDEVEDGDGEEEEGEG